MGCDEARDARRLPSRRQEAHGKIRQRVHFPPESRRRLSAHYGTVRQFRGRRSGQAFDL